MAVPINGPNQTALTELAGVLIATASHEDPMQNVADLAARAVPAATAYGITCPRTDTRSLWHLGE
jgi:hypothetical protein